MDIERNSVTVKSANNKPNSKSKVLDYRVNNNDTQTYRIYLPYRWSNESKVLVCVHGISRKYKQQIRLLKQYASKNDTILVAPYFSNDYHHAFQRHEPGTDGSRSDQVLDHIMTDVSNRHDINTDKFGLFGFSAGAQFAHRYALRNPDKVTKLITCAAGWYTLLDFSKKFPYGLAPDDKGVSRFKITEQNLNDFLKIPITVTVGEYDKRSDSSLNRSKLINASQGYDRQERAINWVKSISSAAEEQRIESHIKFVLIPRSGHSFFECINYGMLPRYLF
jgi:dienelactone hydrolase